MSADLTQLLNRMQAGDRAAADEAVPLIYDELHRIAARAMRGEHPGHLLQTTALIHEAYTRLVGSGAIEVRNRDHFFAIASRQMRRILVDIARSKNAQRHGGLAPRVELDQLQIGVEGHNLNLLLLDDALQKLESIDARAAKVVELRYFGGYTDREVVEALGIALSTVRRDWDFARSWLFDYIAGGAGRPG